MLYVKIYEQLVKKTAFTKNAIIPEIFRMKRSKFDTISLKPISMLFKSFKLVSFNLFEK